MSRSGAFGRWLAAGVLLLLAGCCGSGSAHKCDFTPYDPGKDGGPDAMLACGSQVCQLPQVCCLTKTPPFANCVDQKDFISDGCEMIQLDKPPCVTPQDCDAGVCCYLVNVGTLTCQSAAGCPGDGTDNYRTCSTDQDCPRTSPGTCMNIGSDPSTQTQLNICQP